MKRAVATTALLLALAAVPAGASTFIALGDGELVAQSDAIVVGEVLETYSYWNDEQTMIFTEAVVNVQRVVAGDAPALVNVRAPGGIVGDYKVEAHGFPAFARGQRQLLFLHQTDSGVLEVTGFQQGQYQVVRRAEGLELAVPALGDGTPMHRFDDPLRVCTGSCLAATFTGYYSQRSDGTWRIDDADIVTNTRYDYTTTREPDGCSSEFYIEGIHVHETGHGLGLGHTNVSGATMYPSVSSCNNGPATIAQDDADGIKALYGGGGGGSCTLGQKGDSCSANSDCCSNKCRQVWSHDLQVS